MSYLYDSSREASKHVAINNVLEHACGNTRPLHSQRGDGLDLADNSLPVSLVCMENVMRCMLNLYVFIILLSTALSELEAEIRVIICDEYDRVNNSSNTSLVPMAAKLLILFLSDSASICSTGPIHLRIKIGFWYQSTRCCG